MVRQKRVRKTESEKCGQKCGQQRLNKIARKKNGIKYLSKAEKQHHSM